MTPTTAARLRAPRRRAPAALAAFALALAGLLTTTGPAHAETRGVEEGALAWGFKESFRNYVGMQIAAMPPSSAVAVGERITLDLPAEFDASRPPASPGNTSSPNETLPYLLPVAGGTVTDESNLRITSSGAVTYHFPSHFFEITISKVAVVVAGGKATIEADVDSVITGAFGEFEPGEYHETAVTIGTIASSSVTIDGDVATITGDDVSLTEAGAAYLPYGHGDPLDSFTLTATLGEPEDDGESPVPTPTPTPDAEPEPGELTWRIDGATGVTLGTASVTDDSFLATAALPPVVVTDSRAGGPGWRVTAQVSDFTSADGVLKARHLGWVPALLSSGGGAVAGDVIAPRLVAGKGKGLAVLRTLGRAPAGHSSGTATLGGTLELRAPLGTAPGSYRAVLTITAVS